MAVPDPFGPQPDPASAPALGRGPAPASVTALPFQSTRGNGSRYGSLSVPWNFCCVLVSHDDPRSQYAARLFFSDPVNEVLPRSRVTYSFQRALLEEIEFVLRVGAASAGKLILHPGRHKPIAGVEDFRPGFLLSHIHLPA